MTSLHKISILLSILFLSACSKDETFEKDNIREADISLIGSDLENIFQFDINTNTDVNLQTNLSTELGISNNYLTLRQFGNTISFYSFSNNAISLTQKNLSTSEVTFFPDFYKITSEKSLVWGINNDEFVYFGIFKPLGSTNLALHTVSLESLEGIDLSLEFGIEKLFEPLESNGKLFITYITGGGDYKIIVYDTGTDTIIKTFEYGRLKPSILIDDNANFAVFTQDDNENTFLEIFDSSNLLSLSRTELNFDHPFTAGPINASIVENKLFYQYTYPQPYQIERGPAVLNLSTSENTVLDMLGLINSINDEKGQLIRPFFGTYLTDKNMFAISYILQESIGSEIGGFMLISSNGSLEFQKNLNFIPTYFVD